jgi:hypothetical protein
LCIATIIFPLLWHFYASFVNCVWCCMYDFICLNLFSEYILCLYDDRKWIWLVLFIGLRIYFVYFSCE